MKIVEMEPEVFVSDGPAMGVDDDDVDEAGSSPLTSSSGVDVNRY